MVFWKLHLATAKSKDKRGLGISPFNFQAMFHLCNMLIIVNCEKRCLRFIRLDVLTISLIIRILSKKIVALRLEKVQLFDYPNYAQFVLEERMAETS